MDRVARLSQTVAAMAGLVVAWLAFDWLADPWDHCDYPEECMVWFPRTFALIENIWVASVVAAAVGVILASLAQWRRADMVVLGLSWVALFVPVAMTSAYESGHPISWDYEFDNALIWRDFPAYELVGLVTFVASLVLGWQALRGGKRTDRGQAAIHGPKAAAGSST